MFNWNFVQNNLLFDGRSTKYIDKNIKVYDDKQV